VRLWYPAGDRKRHCDGVFGGCANVSFGCIGDDHTVVGGGFNVDVVDTDARSTDNDEVFGGLEDFFGDIRARAND